jgi:tetratricopeptide (TPR) repeat protein
LLDRQKIARAADDLAKKGLFDKAIREYQRLVQEDPEDGFAWLKIGDLFVKKGDPRQGALCYLKAAEFYSDREPEKAIKVFLAVLSLDPTQVQSHQRLAMLYHAQGKDREAMEQLEPYAAFFEKSQKIDEAIQVRQRMVDLAPEYLPVRIKLAELLLQTNRRDESAREFARVAKQLKQMGRTDDYMMVVERLLFVKPDDKEHLIALAQLYLEQRNPKEALGKLQGLFILDPKNLDVLELLAETFTQLDQRPKAIRVLKEIARLRPEMKPSLFRRILDVDPEDADAKAFLQPTEPTRPEPVLPAAGLSLVGIPSLPSQMAKVPTAGDAQEKDAKVAKKIAEAELYVKFGLQEKAIDHIHDALSMSPDSPALMRFLKDLYVGVGDYPRAASVLLSLARVSPPAEAKTALEQIFVFDAQHAEANAMYSRLGGTRPHQEAEELDVDDSDLIEEAEEDLLEEVAEVVEQVEAQEAQAAAIPKRGRTRPGSTMISMSPFFEVAEVAEVASMHRSTAVDPYSVQGALVPEGAGFYTTETTSRTSLDPVDLRGPAQSGDPIIDGLSEVEYLLQQGLQNEARASVEALYRNYPGDPRVRQKRLDVLMQKRPAPDGGRTIPEQPAKRTVPDAPKRPAPEQGRTIPETRRNHTAPEPAPDAGPEVSPFARGLAYRENGQLAEAIREFQNLVGSGIGDATCYHLIGVCYSDQGQFREAIAAFKQALHVGGLSFEDELGIYYALGATHEATRDYEEATYYYQRVYQRDPRFRDVGARLQGLQSMQAKPRRERESGASPLPVRRDPVNPQAVARGRNDDDHYN